MSEAPTEKPPDPPGKESVTFARAVRPILEARCRPCHFEGGKMYDQYPFDKAETVTKLGTKLFTRIKDEEEKRVIRTFLAESP